MSHFKQVFGVKQEKEKVKRKRRKKDDDDKTKPARRSSTSSNTSNNDAPKKRRKSKKVMNVDEDDEDEVCASKACSRPSGDEVDWVQCDSCEQWFHLVCIGLTSEKAEALESFKCSLCVEHVVNISSNNDDSPESVNVDVDSTTPYANSPTDVMEVDQ